MSLRDELQAIYDQHGKLTPKLVVDAAERDRESMLFSRLHFDDDSKAAEVGRLYLARKLIQSVKVVYREQDGSRPERSVRAFYATRADVDEFDYQFEPVDRVVNDPVKLQIVLRDMEREWKALKARFGHLKEFADMVRSDINEAA